MKMADKEVTYYTASPKKMLWSRFSFKTVLWLLIAIVVVAGSLLGWSLYHSHMASKQEQTDYSKAISEAQTAQNDGGNYVKSYHLLQSAIGSAQTKAQKIEMYRDLAYAAYNTGHITDAINYFSMLRSLDPSTFGGNADILGECYQQIGDKADALKQYKLALAYYQQPDQLQYATINNVIPHIEGEIQALGSK